MQWTDALPRPLRLIATATLLVSLACADDGKSEGGTNNDAETDGDGDGDGDTGDGDTGDGDTGDGDPGDGDPGDGDPGDGDTGDGDGDTGDGDGDTGDGDGDTGDGDGDPGDGDGDPGDGDGDPIMCPDVFPTFDKSCGDVSECAIAIHTTDCCGNSVAIGINVAEVDAFEAAEAICDSQYPPCGCPAGPTVAEDGQAAFDPRTLAVDCVDGSCMTSVK